jgi:hypothetical protein
VLHNLRPGIVIGGRDWATWWHAHREQVPTLLRAELERECERLRLVKDQVRAIESAHRKELAAGKQPLVVRLRAIGPKGAWLFRARARSLDSPRPRFNFAVELHRHRDRVLFSGTALKNRP